MARISVTGGYGTYAADVTTVDLMIERHLPASTAQMRERLALRAPECTEWSRVNVTEALVILAEWYDGDRELGLIG